MEEGEKSLTEKYHALLKKFSDENNLRQQQNAIQQTMRENRIAQAETFAYVEAMLKKNQLAIENKMNTLMLMRDVDNISNVLSDDLDSLGEQIKSLRASMASPTQFLKPFEVRLVLKTIADLEKKYRKMVMAISPRKKFAFTSVPKARKDNNGQGSTMGAGVKSGEKFPSFPQDYRCVDYSAGFTNKVGETLTLDEDAVYLKDICLSQLKDCTVEIKGAPGLLTVTSLTNCKVNSGPVSTSIFIENCSNCLFVVACQQLRVHDTSSCDFRVHVTSRAIIEGTTRVRFGPYDWRYDGMRGHFKVAGLDMNTNHWDAVDDFNWLATDKPSPNWVRMCSDPENTETQQVLHCTCCQ